MAEKSQSLEFPATDLIERALHARPRRLRAECSGISPSLERNDRRARSHLVASFTRPLLKRVTRDNTALTGKFRRTKPAGRAALPVLGYKSTGGSGPSDGCRSSACDYAPAALRRAEPIHDPVG